MDKKILYFIKHTEAIINLIFEKNNITEYQKKVCQKILKKCEDVKKSEELNEEQLGFIRRLIKRFNLSLKIDKDGNKLDINDPDIQKNIEDYKNHPFINLHTQSNIESFINDLGESFLFIEIPINDIFIKDDINNIRKIGIDNMSSIHEYYYRLVGYIRLNFYISQIILLRCNKDDPKYELKTKLITYNTSLIPLLSSQNIDGINNMIQNISTKNLENVSVSEASDSTKKMVKQAGLDNLDNLIDSISNKISNINEYDGDIIDYVISIANDVMNDNTDVLTEITDNPEKIQSLFSILNKFECDSGINIDIDQI